MDLIRKFIIHNRVAIYRFVHLSIQPHHKSNIFKRNNLLPATLLQIQPVRDYAKGKDKKKDHKKPVKVEINEEFLNNYINYNSFASNLQKHLETMRDEYIKNLSLRSTTGAIETLLVNVDGTEHELQELAQIVRKNPKTIVVNMINFPQTIPAVLLAIQKSGMNLNPQQDGTTLFIPVPKVTKEHRENLSKSAKILFVKCRDAIKETQNQTIKKLKKQEKIPEDDLHMCLAQVGALAEQIIGQAEKMLETKQNELLGGKE